jgi:hypothetical protein
MANVKNFGLIGVGSDLQYGKAGPRIINSAGVFNFKALNGSTDAALTTAGITSSAGNITLTTGNVVATAGNLVATAGNVVLSSNSGVVTLGDAGSIGRAGTGVYSFSGTGAMVVPSGTTGQEPDATSYTGGFRYNTTLSKMEFSNGAIWTTVGDTGPLQTEIDNIEASLGAGIDASGNFVAASFNGPIATATSFTNAINQLGAYALAHDTLDEIFAPGTLGNVIYSDGTNWQKAQPGATSGVQAYDAGLEALAAKTSTGIMVQTGADTYASRTLVAPAAGFTITDAAGIAGNPTFALANDLAALEGLSTLGIISRTGDGTATTISITGTAGQIEVSNGSGAAGDPTLSLADVGTPAASGFWKFSTDAKGRVPTTTAVVAGDITALVDATYVNVTGDTMNSGASLTFVGGGTVTGLPLPTADSDAASKAYVDAVAQGLHVHEATQVVQAANIGTYANGTAGVGATLTVPSTTVIDGFTLVQNASESLASRIMVTGQTNTFENGIYWATSATVWTRSTDFDTTTEVAGGDFVFNQEGTLYANTGWVETETTTAIGTSPILFQQFSGAGSYSAGTGLSLTGTVFSVNLGAGIGEFSTNNVGIDLYSTTASALILTDNGTSRSTTNTGKLELLLAGSGGLTQDATGLYIPANGITNAMIVNDFFSATADSGSDTLTLGDGLHIHGVTLQGTSVTVSETPAGTTDFAITVADASSSQKGVAKFDATQFVVTAGNVVLGTVPLTALAQSTITFTGTSGSDAVQLGESMAIIGADSMITTTMGANSLSIQLGTVDVSHGGTGVGTFAVNEILFGAGTSPLATSPDFKFTPGATVDTLSIGGASGLTLTTDSASSDVVLTALGTNGDIVAIPNGTGSFIVGTTGAGLIQSDAAQALTVRGNTTLTLTSVTGDTTMALPSGTGSKVTVSGPTAADYAIGLAAADLVNKQYVDNAIAVGASAGAVKAVSAVVNLSAAASINIGAVLPAGSTILSVKVKVTAADTATGTLVVGKSGGSEYMVSTENDTQTVGMYIAEDMVTEAGAVQVQATVAGTPGGAGFATVVVTYQVDEV